MLAQELPDFDGRVETVAEWSPVPMVVLGAFVAIGLVLVLALTPFVFRLIGVALVFLGTMVIACLLLGIDPGISLDFLREQKLSMPAQ